MKDIEKISDDKLLELITFAEYSTKQIFSKDFDRKTTQYLFPVLDYLYDITAIREQEKYQQMLNLIIRMGLQNRDSVIPVSNLSTKDKDRLVIHMLLLAEARKRKIDVYDEKERFRAINHPVFIEEVPNTKDFGNRDNLPWVIGTFDYPVRKACVVLFSKGYIPYWSSANKKDVSERTGHVVKGKNVAYILIDPEGLSDELKERLLLDGENKFDGITESHQDNGKYYGIWQEIISPKMDCDELSKLLFKKAIELPDIYKENREKVHQEEQRKRL